MAKQTAVPRPDPFRIFLIDDHEVPRRGFAALLDNEPDFQVCGQAGDSSQALGSIPAATPDLIISDLSLPGTSGVDFIKLLRGHFPGIPLLVFSMYDEHVYGERVLRAGAHGYVMKSEPVDRVMSAVRFVLGGERFLSAAMQGELLEKFLHSGKQRANPAGPAGCLTNRELEIVQLIGEGLKSSQVATRLGISVKTIESHRENIKGKLDLKNAVELSRFAFEWAGPRRSV